RFTVVSDAAALTMGHYDTTKLPLAKEDAAYTLLDNFFHAAFGGSFLNHFWLICACTPEWKGAPKNQRTVLDPATRLPIEWPKPEFHALTAVDEGDFAVNSVQPLTAPFDPAVADSAKRLPLQTMKTIGDRLDAAALDWGWYSGGWADAESGHADESFQFHHQPFNYFAKYTRGAPGR